MTYSYYEDLLTKAEERRINKQLICPHDGEKVIICRECGKHLEETNTVKKLKSKPLFTKKIRQHGTTNKIN